MIPLLILTPLPRFANRGLIEAGEVILQAQALRPDFPDSRIGASLKPRRSSVLASRIGDFPDSRIGASLKQAIVPRVALLPLHFPDSRIGASLKRRHLPRDGGLDDHFPDSRIGASLKPTNVVLNVVAYPGLPRFANRGLIEARPLDRHPLRGVRLPRFANRGLIEAASARTRTGSPSHFPDSRIGASLKPATGLRPSPNSDLLPRFANRGLIEAGGVRAPEGQVGNFPDSRIGASLKRPAGRRHWRTISTSPIRESGPH